MGLRLNTILLIQFIDITVHDNINSYICSALKDSQAVLNNCRFIDKLCKVSSIILYNIENSRPSSKVKAFVFLGLLTTEKATYQKSTTFLPLDNPFRVLIPP